MADPIERYPANYLCDIMAGVEPMTREIAALVRYVRVERKLSYSEVEWVLSEMLAESGDDSGWRSRAVFCCGGDGAWCGAARFARAYATASKSWARPTLDSRCVMFEVASGTVIDPLHEVLQ